MAQTAPPIIVTIDGPAGVGKSTIAKQVAEALHVAYLDTGAMFRTIALGLAVHSVQPLNAPHTVEDFTPAMQNALATFVFSLSGSGNSTTLLCNGNPIGNEIRTEEAALMAAKFAQVPQVRAYLKQAQQHLGNNYSFVAEGRDMGTEVFPSAPFKFFLDARPEVRAQRRYDQLIAMGKPANLHELTQQIAERDHQDRTRAIAPLIPASDAHIVDTSHLTIHQVFSAIITTVTQRQ